MNKDLARGNQLVQVHTQFERAARIYCERSGINADEAVHLPSSIKPRIVGAPSPVIRIERWRLIAEELYDLSVRLVALRQAKQEEPAAEIVQ